MEKIKIKGYPDYELHYSKDEQLVYSKKREKYLKLCKDKGYLKVSLSKNGKTRTFRIHQLVWMCLKGEIPTELEINHIDENKENNCIENLELVTPKQNINHGTRTERAAKAISIANKISLIGNHNRPQKPVIAVKKDLSEILNYPSTMEAQRDVEKGFDQGHISSCCLNKKSFKSHKGYYWFFKSDFEEYLTKFNNDLEKVIEYKKSISK